MSVYAYLAVVTGSSHPLNDRVRALPFHQEFAGDIGDEQHYLLELSWLGWLVIVPLLGMLCRFQVLPHDVLNMMDSFLHIMDEIDYGLDRECCFSHASRATS